MLTRKAEALAAEEDEREREVIKAGENLLNLVNISGSLKEKEAETQPKPITPPAGSITSPPISEEEEEEEEEEEDLPYLSRQSPQPLWIDLSSDEEVANQEKYDIKQKKKLIMELDPEMAYLIRQINKVRSLFI